MKRNHAAADAFVRERVLEVFSWESHNCCTFCAGFVRAFTGVDHLGEEANVASVRDALRAVRRYGTLADAVTAKLGPPVPPTLAQYGDVVLFPNTHGVGDSLGICVGANVLAPGLGRLELVPLSAAVQAWRLPLETVP